MSQSRGIVARIREFFSTPPPAPRPRWKAVNLTRQTVLASDLEVADTGSARGKGLLGRTGLAAGEGLWIIPCEAVHTFGMKFSIDLVYLDRKHRVRKIRSDVPARRLSACMTAHSILELPAGTIQQTLTRAGDMVKLSSAEAVNNLS